MAQFNCVCLLLISSKLLAYKCYLFQCCVQKFRTSLAVGGYQLSKERDVYAGEKEGIPRVMACAYSTDRFAVLLH